jgi:hypothetical protein
MRPRLSSVWLAGLAIGLLSAIPASVRGQEIEPPYGEISGIVVDQNAQPVPGVEVTADDSGGRAHVGPVPRCESDARGHFTLVSVRPGDVIIHTAKQQDGYVDTQWGAVFDTPERLTSVTVLEGQHVSQVVVRIGPPVGVVSGVVLTPEGKPLPARIEVMREDIPEAFLSMGANEMASSCWRCRPSPTRCGSRQRAMSPGAPRTMSSRCLRITSSWCQARD